MYQVNPGTSNAEWATISQSTTYVQQTMALSFGYSSYAIPNGVESLVKFQNNQLVALTSISTLTSLSNSNFNYQYYPNINLCSFIKSNSNTDYGFNLGSYPTSIDE